MNAAEVVQRVAQYTNQSPEAVWAVWVQISGNDDPNAPVTALQGAELSTAVRRQGSARAPVPQTGPTQGIDLSLGGTRRFGQPDGEGPTMLEQLTKAVGDALGAPVQPQIGPGGAPAAATERDTNWVPQNQNPGQAQPASDRIVGQAAGQGGRLDAPSRPSQIDTANNAQVAMNPNAGLVPTREPGAFTFPPPSARPDVANSGRPATDPTWSNAASAGHSGVSPTQDAGFIPYRDARDPYGSYVRASQASRDPFPAGASEEPPQPQTQPQMNLSGRAPFQDAGFQPTPFYEESKPGAGDEFEADVELYIPVEINKKIEETVSDTSLSKDNKKVVEEDIKRIIGGVLKQSYGKRGETSDKTLGNWLMGGGKKEEEEYEKTPPHWTGGGHSSWGSAAAKGEGSQGYVPSFERYER